MFLKRRSLQEEYFDLPERPEAELAEAYRMLRHMNHLFLLSGLIQRRVPTWLGKERCRSLSILDVGAGDGAVGSELTAWAKKRGWEWRITSVELHPQVMALNAGGRFVAASALSLPFRDNSFDVVLASQMAHHLGSDAEVSRHFAEAWRVTNDLLFMNDLHRNAALHWMVGFLVRAHGYPEHFCSDAELSVRRSWRVPEWRELAGRAGIPDAGVSLYAGARVLLRARKKAH